MYIFAALNKAMIWEALRRYLAADMLHYISSFLKFLMGFVPALKTSATPKSEALIMIAHGIVIICSFWLPSKVTDCNYCLQ